MAGWSKAKRKRVEAAFYEFLSQCYINSKDSGRTCLGENLYDGQRRFITEVFDALEDDIHDIYCLKSRQLGISTIVRALIIFFEGIFDGVRGAIVLDTDFNKVAARAELVGMIGDLPRSLEFPGIKFNNVHGLTLENSSTTLFFQAGVKKTKGSGALGRSIGLSLAALSELCSYDNEEGLEAFENSLSDLNPNRLYIRESTARGFNHWHTKWVEARADKEHKRCIFLGWWSKPSQSIPVSHPDFARYGMEPPTDIEARKIKEVKELYNHEITPQQLAWIRRRMDPAHLADAKTDHNSENYRLQEQAWVESDAFRMTGAAFFRSEPLTEQAAKNAKSPASNWMFSAGAEFVDMRVYRAPNARSTELKVWEEPKRQGIYIVSADVGYGLSERADRSSIQVCRAYADGLDQVAEYAWPLIGTKPFAWVIMALAGWYSQDNQDVYLIIERNGPGHSVWDEIVSMRSQIASGYQRTQLADMGLENIFRNIRNYVFSRPDALRPSFTWQWQTTPGNGPTGKIRLMERLRDFTNNGMLRIRSLTVMEEMKAIERVEDSIGAPSGKKDDRTVALALNVRCWEERVRRGMITRNQTRDVETAKETMTFQDAAKLFSQYQISAMFTSKHEARRRQQMAASSHRWGMRR